MPELEALCVGGRWRAVCTAQPIRRQRSRRSDTPTTTTPPASKTVKTMDQNRTSAAMVPPVCGGMPLVRLYADGKVRQVSVGSFFGWRG